jgi:hypothetical protein
MRHPGSGRSRVRVSRNQLSVPPDALRAQAPEAGLAMNHAEKKPLREPHRPENELAVLLWVIAVLLACLNVVWWLGEHMYS